MTTFVKRSVTVKQDEKGLFVVYKSHYSYGDDKLVIRPDPKRVPSHPFKVGDKVQVQMINPNMGWYNVFGKGAQCADQHIWSGPNWVQGFGIIGHWENMA